MKSPKKRFRETFGRSSLYFEYFEYFEIQKIQNIQNIQNNEITKKEVQRDFWEKFIIFWIFCFFWNSKKNTIFKIFSFLANFFEYFVCFFEIQKNQKNVNAYVFDFFEFSEFKNYKKLKTWIPQKWEAGLAIVIYTVYGKNSILNYVFKKKSEY